MSRKRPSGGRVTPKGARPGARTRSSHEGHPRTRARGQIRAPVEPESSSRYSRPRQDYVVRPAWHRIAGWIGVVVGILIAVLNDAMLIGDGLVLLPFGHSELYLVLGVVVAGWSTRFLGMFDRDTVYV